LVRQPDCANLPREDALQRYKQQFNTETIDIVRKAVFERMSALESLRDIESLIVNEVVDTPATYADFYNVGAGTPFALSHGLGQLSLSRPGFTVSNHPNVVFVGASTRPGNGVPLVLISAKLAANTVLEKLEKRANARM
jgi:phytoene dehydrogenase-like protein